MPLRFARSLVRLSLVAAMALAVPGAAAPVVALTPSAAPAATADWTMMVYAVGDTEVVPEVMVRNLNRLTEIPDAANVHIVALVDLPERTDPSAPQSEIRGVGQFTTAKLLVLDGGRWNEIRDLGEQSLGRPDVLARFIAEAAGRFPARKYGLTLFDHGAAYEGGYIDVGPPARDGMSISEIRTGMASGMQAAGISRFDLLFHAACLMSSYETVSALAPLARTLAGSEELMISTPILPDGYVRMAADASGAEVAAGLADGYGRFLETLDGGGGGDPRQLAAMSVVDGDRVRGLDLALEAFARAAARHASDIAAQVARARARALEFVVGLDPEAGSRDLVDLGDFLRQLGPLPQEVALARNSVYAAIKSAVLHQVTGAATQQATGLNVFLPSQAARATDYLNEGVAPRGWAGFLTSFVDSVAAATDGEPDARFAAQEPRLERLPGGVRLTAQLRPGDGARAVTARTRILADVGGFTDALTVSFPAYLGAGGADQVQGTWSYQSLVVTDGRTVLPMTALFRAQVGGMVGTAYGTYTSPTGQKSDVLFRVFLDTDAAVTGWSVSAVARDGSLAGLRLQQGGTLAPVMLVETPSGFEARDVDRVVQTSPELGIGFRKLRPGTPFTFGLLVGDVADQRALTYTRGTVS